MKQRNKIIAIVDDDTRHIDFYIRALESIGYSVNHFNSPDAFLSAINSGSRFIVYIIDLMMPPGDIYSIEDSQGGILTGALLACDLRRHDALNHIIVLTNLNIKSIINDVDIMLSNLKNISIFKKGDFSPLKLAQYIEALLEEGLSPIKRGGILNRFFRSLIIKPNFYGIGIDIDKFIPKGKKKLS